MRRAPLQPMSAKRRKQLAESGNAFPASTFLPKPKKAKAVKDTGPDAATVDAVLQRDGYQCVVGGCALFGERGVDYSIHHRKLRSQGGDNRLSNLVAVCGHGSAGHHGDIHGAPAKAREAGWIVSRDQDPAEAVMAHSLYGYVRLTNAGGVA